jgi:Bacterial aa3 type cytochrome c oxidase subunit IV
MSIDTSRGHEAMDYNEHNRTYAGFIRMTQVAVVFLIVLLTGMYIFLV